MNWIKVGWIAVVPVSLVYAIWFWPDTSEGQEQAKRHQNRATADRLCERMHIAADNGQERLAAIDMCEAMKKATPLGTKP
jgi:hypothetical protein